MPINDTTDPNHQNQEPDGEEVEELGAADPTSDAGGRALETRSTPAEVAPAALQGAIELLAALPAEDVWLEGLESARTRRAYKNDVADFVASLGVRSSDELYAVTPAAVIAWRRRLEAPKADVCTRYGPPRPPTHLSTRRTSPTSRSGWGTQISPRLASTIGAAHGRRTPPPLKYSTEA